MLKISLIAAVAVAVVTAAAAAAPAFAQDAVSDIVQRNVSYADLDLSAPAGVAALDQRIAMAVTQVCGHADLHDLGAWKAMQQCRVDARSKIEQTRNTLVASAKAQKAAKSVVLAAK
jgi:UrcA family protein